METIVTTQVAPLYEGAYYGALLCDELLCGTAATVLQQLEGGWLCLRAAHGYRGYGRAEHFLPDRPRAAQWLGRPHLVVTGSCVDVQREPRVKALSTATLLRGSLVAAAGDAIDGWQPVELAGGQEGYLPAQHLSPYPLGQDMGWRELRQAVCATASSYLGCCYRWGGKTPLGLDCSGLTSQVYLLYGYTIWRDSALLPSHGVREIDRRQLRPADLLYWPGHTALYLGEERYIHSTATAAGVCVNSLTPAHPDYRADLAETLAQCGTVLP